MRRAARYAVALLGAVTLVVGGVPAPGFAFDLTGNWTGVVTCTSFFTGEKLKFVEAPTIQITQSGSAIGMRADYGAGHVDFYTGLAIADAKKPDEKGELGLIACGTDSVAGNASAFDEVGRFAVTTKPDQVKATAKGLSFFSDPGTAAPEAGSCKWKLTRVDTADPGVSTQCSGGTL